MGVESFQERLKVGRGRLRREQRRRSWASVAGLLAAIVALIASGPIFDVGVPDSMDQVAYVVWVLASWLGALSLFAFGVVSSPSKTIRNASHAGLWIGMGAVAASAAVMPLGLVLMLVPVAVGASIVGRIAGFVFAALYLLVPVIAVLVSAMFQYYGGNANDVLQLTLRSATCLGTPSRAPCSTADEPWC